MPKRRFDRQLLNLQVEYRPIGELRPNPRNAKKHPPKQKSLLTANMRRLGMVTPLISDEHGTILAGNLRLEAAKAIGLTTVPVIRLTHLTEAEKQIFAIADNRLSELGEWDLETLGGVVQDLVGLDLHFDLEITGFDGAALDKLLGLEIQPRAEDPLDRIPETTGPAVSRLGDLWVLGKHRLICGDARDPEIYARLMDGQPARMVLTDPPYNVEIVGHAGGKGRIARRPFVMAAGEMSPAEFRAFLKNALTQMEAVLRAGGLAYVFMDWRHLADLLATGETVFKELKNIVVWDKGNAGLGAFYRSQHEMIAIFKKGTAPHLNTFGMGDKGRYRTNVWNYPGLNSFGQGRDEALAMHATVKPVSLLADAIKDVTRPGEIVVDPFAGSGSTLIAAEKTRRVARLIELDPLYCDTVCRRWATFAKAPSVLKATDQTFDQVESDRNRFGKGTQSG